MRISDWSSDVCSSDLIEDPEERSVFGGRIGCDGSLQHGHVEQLPGIEMTGFEKPEHFRSVSRVERTGQGYVGSFARAVEDVRRQRSEEHTSELQSLMRISYAVFCLNKKKSHT